MQAPAAPQQPAAPPPGYGVGVPGDPAQQSQPPQNPAGQPGASPWQQAPPPTAESESSDKGNDAVKAKVFAIGGGIVTVLLILVGVVYIFGLSMPEDCSMGGATPIEVNSQVTGEFTAFRTTQLYEFRQVEAGEVTITARFDAEMYIELQHAGRPIQRGVGRISAPLSPGVYQVMIRPHRQGSGSYTLLIAGQRAVPEGVPVPDPLAPPPLAPPIAH